MNGWAIGLLALVILTPLALFIRAAVRIKRGGICPYCSFPSYRCDCPAPPGGPEGLDP